MLERLSIDGLELNPVHTSVLDVYCSDVAKRMLEGNLSGVGNLFDRVTPIVMGPMDKVDPVLLPNFTLIERNEFYGIIHDGNRQYLPAQVLADTFGAVFMDTPIELPEPRQGEEQAPKHAFLKAAYSKGQVGKEFRLEFRPEVALDLTQRLRNYLPNEVNLLALKGCPPPLHPATFPPPTSTPPRKSEASNNKNQFSIIQTVP